MPYFYPLTEYVRPWKLFSLLCGIALLIIGARYSGLPDWDVPVSLIMAVFAYFTAPCSMQHAGIFGAAMEAIPTGNILDVVYRGWHVHHLLEFC